MVVSLFNQAVGYPLHQRCYGDDLSSDGSYRVVRVVGDITPTSLIEFDKLCKNHFGNRVIKTGQTKLGDAFVQLRIC